MLDQSTPDPSNATTESTPAAAPRRRRAASRPAGPPPDNDAVRPPETAEPTDVPVEAPAKKPAAKRAPRKRVTKTPVEAPDVPASEASAPQPTVDPEPAIRKATKRAPRAGATKQDAAAAPAEPTPEPVPAAPPGALFSAVEETPTPTRRRRVTTKAAAAAPAEQAAADPAAAAADPAAPAGSVTFQPPDPAPAPTPRRRTRKAGPPPDATDPSPPSPVQGAVAETTDSTLVTDRSDDSDGEDEQGDAAPRRRRRRGGRRRRRGSGGGEEADTAEADSVPSEDSAGSSTESGRPGAEGDQQDRDADENSDEENESGTTRRRRRRRRRGEGSEPSQDDPANTVVRIRERRAAEDEISSISGSTRLEAKKQRRREGRDAGRRRAPIVSESEFLARRESVKREMVIRQRKDLSQIAVLEDGVLVEHYVARDTQTSLIGNVYLGRVQNVLPSMEAAFIDIGKGRNAVLYAGEVDWKAVGAEGRSRKIEEVLKSGQSILVQVTKDPVGNKGARLTGQVSLPGRFLVYVPGGQSSGISRKLPDTERARLKALLKDTLPEGAGVIIRTAAEGASEEQLTRDVGALTARWEDIESKSKASSNAPQLLYGEPDLTIKVVRDLFNEDFGSLVVQGDDAWDMIDGYVTHVAPDLSERLSRWDDGSGERDSFAAHRIDEQIAKALDRKVWLPSGGSLVIDRTEAMTVVDVNTGKFTGSGGNLEETVTKNNLEACEEIVRQLRLRDIGGIIVVDFIDMVLEDNRDLVLRRMIECLGRDRTRHQVAEVTSLGLVQMTRKRIGTGLLEAFSESCESCRGRGLTVHTEPVDPARKGGGKSASSAGSPEDASSSSDDGNGRRGRRGRGRGGSKRGDGDAETTGDDSTTEHGGLVRPVPL